MSSWDIDVICRCSSFQNSVVTIWFSAHSLVVVSSMPCDFPLYTLHEVDNKKWLLLLGSSWLHSKVCVWKWCKFFFFYLVMIIWMLWKGFEQHMLFILAFMLALVVLTYNPIFVTGYKVFAHWWQWKSITYIWFKLFWCTTTRNW